MKPLSERELAILSATLKFWADCGAASDTLEIHLRDGTPDHATMAEVCDLSAKLFMAVPDAGSK